MQPILELRGLVSAFWRGSPPSAGSRLCKLWKKRENPCSPAIECGFSWTSASTRDSVIASLVTTAKPARTTNFDDLPALLPDVLEALEILGPAEVVRIGIR